MTRASISIFPQKIEYSDSGPRPETPPEVFMAAQRIAEQKNGCELVRNKSGLYIVTYSATGPGKDSAGWDSWLPIYVAKATQWTSGGIQQKEMDEFLEGEKHEE